MNDKLGKFNEVYNKIRKEQGIDTVKNPASPKEKPKDAKKPEQKQTTPLKNK